MNLKSLKENFEKFLNETNKMGPLQVDADVLLDKLNNNTSVLEKLKQAGLSIGDFDSIDFIKIAKEAADYDVNTSSAYDPSVEVIDISYADMYKPDEQKVQKLYNFLDDNLEELGLGEEYMIDSGISDEEEEADREWNRSNLEDEMKQEFGGEQ